MTKDHICSNNFPEIIDFPESSKNLGKPIGFQAIQKFK